MTHPANTPKATGTRTADWWKRVIDRWGFSVAIRLAQRHAQRNPGPIYDYTEWRNRRQATPPWGATWPTSVSEVHWL